MRRYFKEHNLGKVIFFCASILVGILTVSTGSLFIANKVSSLEQDLIRLEEDFIAQQKDQLRTDVTSLLTRINIRHDFLLDQLQKELKQRVEEARLVATNIYLTMQEDTDTPAILEMIREAIRPMRINDEQGYCFIFNFQGDALLYPADVRLEGTNFFTNQLAGGGEVFSDLLNIALNKGRGFLEYDWYKPTESVQKRHRKISYVTRFDPLSLVFGTGEYYDNLDTLARTSMISELNDSWRDEKDDYYFVYKLNEMEGGDKFATMLINNNRPDLIGKTISDQVVDIHGKPFRKEFMEGIRSKGDAFVVYWYKKADGSGYGRKLSYFKLYPRWNWIVARGIYLDKFDAAIALKQKELRKRVKKDIVHLTFIFLFGIILSLLIALVFARELQAIFNNYRGIQQQNVSELKSLNEALKAQSRTDQLTQIYNRGYFNERLEAELVQLARYGGILSVILFDIDHFKSINDSFGHLTGDRVLVDLSQLVQENIRVTDTFARWGGEEFVILSPGLDAGKASVFAEKLRGLIENHDFSLSRTVTCSFGVGGYKEGEQTKDLVLRVDKALYRAKDEGRNRCVVADAGIDV